MATSARQAAAKKAAADAGTKAPYMSEYDKQVELRLQALESQAHAKCDGGGSGADADRLAALEAKLEDLIVRLNKKINI